MIQNWSKICISFCTKTQVERIFKNIFFSRKDFINEMAKVLDLLAFGSWNHICLAGYIRHTAQLRLNSEHTFLCNAVRRQRIHKKITSRITAPISNVWWLHTSGQALGGYLDAYLYKPIKDAYSWSKSFPKTLISRLISKHNAYLTQLPPSSLLHFTSSHSTK